MLPFGKPRTTNATTVPVLLLFFFYDANDNLIFQKTSSICTQPLLLRQPQTLEVFVFCSNRYIPIASPQSAKLWGLRYMRLPKLHYSFVSYRKHSLQERIRTSICPLFKRPELPMRPPYRACFLFFIQRTGFVPNHYTFHSFRQVGAFKRSRSNKKKLSSNSTKIPHIGYIRIFGYHHPSRVSVDANIFAVLSVELRDSNFFQKTSQMICQTRQLRRYSLIREVKSFKQVLFCKTVSQLLYSGTKAIPASSL